MYLLVSLNQDQSNDQSNQKSIKSKITQFLKIFMIIDLSERMKEDDRKLILDSCPYFGAGEDKAIKFLSRSGFKLRNITI